jgi:5'(3')-deoxyribonucleotidase
MFWILFSAYFLAMAYLPWSVLDSPYGLPVGVSLNLVAYFVGIFTSRYLRHGKHGLSTTKALRKLHLQKTPTVALDVDGVLADQVPHVLAKANPEKHVNMTKSDVTEWDTMIGDEPFTTLILRYLKEPQFVATMPEMPGAKKGVDMVRMRANIKVASSRPYETQQATESWLRSKFDFDGIEFVNTTITGKTMISADTLIDDNIDNLIGFVNANKGRWGLLLLQPWNEKKVRTIQSFVDKNTIIVAKDWQEIASWLDRS